MTIDPNNYFNTVTTNHPENPSSQNPEQPANLNQIGSLATNILNSSETNNLPATLRPLPTVNLARFLTEEDTILNEKENFEKSLNDWLHDSSAEGDKAEVARRIQEAYNNESTRLDLPELNLTSLPDSIGNLTALTEIDLSFNKLISIPDSIGNLTALTEIDLSNNHLTFLPDSIGNLMALIILNLNHNHLRSVPDSIGNLTALTEIDLSFNKLISIPDSIGNLKALTKLNLSNNHLTFLPDSIGNLMALIILNLNYNHLRSVPDSIGNLKALTKLLLFNNHLSSFPGSIGNLSALIMLDLNFNELTSIPTSIGNLRALTELCLIRNQLTSIPPEIGNLTALTLLSLSNNRLTSIPTSIGNLMALIYLSLHINQLTSIPPEIGNLTELSQLYLESNHLTSIPVEIGNLVSLEVLSINHNPLLRELPLSLGNIPLITELDNEGTQITQEMIDGILALCRSHRDQEALNVLPARLNAWKQYAKGNASQNHDLDFILQFDESEKRNINEWLERLSKTGDFRNNQSKLAHIVCSMLETLKQNQEFKEKFFAQVESNNEHCQDRAAMALNEIYSCWRLYSMDQHATLQEKITLLSGIAKTNALRLAVSHALVNKDIGESVEIYLYYETRLKQELGLVTAIDTMAYSEMGKREWIDENTLKQIVENTYRKFLVELPMFEKLALQDPSFADQKKKIDEDSANLMTKLDEEQAKNSDKEEKLSEEEYRLKGQKLIKDKQEALDKLAITWFDEQQAQKKT